VRAGLTEGVEKLHPRDVPAKVRPHLQRILARLARARGADDGELERDAGCDLPWRAGAPVGQYARLDLARPLDDAAFAAPAASAARGCRVLAITPDARPGAIPVGVELDVPVVTKARLVVDTNEPFRVWLDGTATPMPDEHAPIVKRRAYELPLTMGKHRLAVVVAAPSGRVELFLDLTSDLPIKIAAASGAHFTKAARITPEKERPRPAQDLVSLYLDAERALEDGDSVRARRDAVGLAAGKSAAALSMAARVASEDPTVPSRIARDRGRRLYEQALRLDPKASRVREALGRLALDRDRPRDALELAQVPLENTSAAIALTDGTVIVAGDVDHHRFSYQSAAKLLVLAALLEERGPVEVFRVVGSEPSGDKVITWFRPVCLPRAASAASSSRSCRASRGSPSPARA